MNRAPLKRATKSRAATATPKAAAVPKATPKAKRPVGRPAFASDDPLKATRARAAEASAHWNELKSSQLEGELVDAAAVVRRYAGIVADARARLLAVGPRVGAKLPHLALDVIDLIDHEIRAALSDLGG